MDDELFDDTWAYRGVRTFVEINMDAHSGNFAVFLGADFMLDHRRHSLRLAAQRFFPRIVIDSRAICLECYQSRPHGDLDRGFFFSSKTPTRWGGNELNLVLS